MSTYIALLRAINVGGTAKVAMSELRAAVSEMGFDDVQTVLQTGNLVLRGEAASEAAIARQLEEQARKRLGLRTAFIVRTAKDWQADIAKNPFPDAAESDPSHLVVMFLKDAPEENAVKALREAIKGREVVQAHGKHLYVVYPDGIGRSRLTIDLIERKLGTQGTGRNWNTVLKLAAPAAATP
ncbi:MAG: DUF1697 domain-containing protein [Chloroflexota bacterium]